MRRFLISILLAGAAATPALAQDHGDGRRHHDQEESDNSQRSQRHEERQQAREQARTERQDARSERPQFEMRTQQAQPTESHAQRADGVSRWTRDTVQQAGDTSRWTRDPDQRAGETSRWTRDRSTGWNGTQGGLRQSDRPVPGVMQTRNPLIVNDTQRNGPREQLRERSRWASGGWNREWRNDRRYDWRNYRERHRSVFRLGVYYDPFGFGYRSFNIGYNLGPAYYGQQYWIDPAIYSLPYPPPGTQWVRYWDDALLVDVYSGEVVDVIHGFFW
ncbi:MAG: RcnB family protein [Sphingomicrobium sp.]